MIRIQITSPFRYKYDVLKKDVFFTAGDYYHLDPVKDLAEAKHILSPYFPFKNYIYVDLETVPDNLKEDIGIENGFYDDFTLPKNDEVIPTAIDFSGQFISATDGSSSDEGPVQDPVPNKFDLTTDPNAVKTEDTLEDEDVSIKVVPLDEEVKELNDTGVVESPKPLPVVELPNEDDETIEEVKSGGIGDRTERKAELEDLHYKKVQELAELYNIEYTNKKETIDVILSQEFGDPEDQPEDIKLID